jgi:hypothetical protein
LGFQKRDSTLQYLPLLLLLLCASSGPSSYLVLIKFMEHIFFAKVCFPALSLVSDVSKSFLEQYLMVSCMCLFPGHGFPLTQFRGKLSPIDLKIARYLGLSWCPCIVSKDKQSDWNRYVEAKLP